MKFEELIMKQYNSEKFVDFKLQMEFYKIFGFIYNTKSLNVLFSKLRPDGWFVFNKNLLIIENKQKNNNKEKGLNQAINYFKIVQENIKKFDFYFNNYFIIIGSGNTENDFGYTIYLINDNKIEKTDMNFKDLKENL
jgi:hypothetical protein